jgi:hypothetical protein
MLEYSKLSKPQMDIIDNMRKGYELKFNRNTLKFNIDTGAFILKVNNSSADGLKFRNYIKECFSDKDVIVFCLNVEIVYPQ